MNLPINIPKQNSNVLIAGCGGGYDFLCGLPIGSRLMMDGHNVFYANYSFTDLQSVQDANWITPSILSINADSGISKASGAGHIKTNKMDFFNLGRESNASQKDVYFPEQKFSEYFKVKHKKEVPVFCFPRIGIKSLTKAYNDLCELLSIDMVIIIDGGVDGIFRGDEYGLGTPSMDAVSIIAASLSQIGNKFYIMTAFGSEGTNHDVSHADVLQRIADLSKLHGYYGVSALTSHSPSSAVFTEAVRYIFDHSDPLHHGNIVSSMLRSYEGNFGHMAVNVKTTVHPIWVSPLTSMFWYFDLDCVAKIKLYYKNVIDTDSVADVANSIEELRNGMGLERKFPGIPSDRKYLHLSGLMLFACI